MRNLALLILVAAVFAGGVFMRGQGGPWSARVLILIDTLIRAGWAPLGYLLAGAGYGRLVRRWIPTQQGSWCIELGFGLTALLSTTHFVGMIGMLSTLSAWIITGIGLVLYLPRLKEIDTTRLPPRPYLTHLLVACGVVLAFVMACNPPGVLWASEYGGFDALSYHLQLPREWIEQGRIWPCEHNVYSFLPSYVEAAYAHMSLMMGGGMQANDARAAMSAQLLSTFMLVLSAGAIGELARAASTKIMPDADGVLARRFAVVLTLGTPWLLVVGTLAYNEIAVVLLGVCALLVAMLSHVSVWKRAALCGVIVGGACCCKPTALFMIAPSVGIVLLACSAKKQWLIAILMCIVIGAVTISPWLIRNELATGNPVFPQMRSVFGDGHWNEAQHAVYSAAHAFEGSIVDRFAMLFAPDLDADAQIARYRGLTNLQWGLTPLLGMVGLLALLIVKKSRSTGLVSLMAIGVPIVAWALLTHVQSRFLIPLAPILIVLGSLALVRVNLAVVREMICKVLALLVIIWTGAMALQENSGNPFILFDLGAGYSMGSYDMEQLPWTAALNHYAQDGETVYLLGDATPFYILGDVRYNTVYDDWLIATVADEYSGSPSDWTSGLRDRGVDLVVISFAEIVRYEQSGWLPGSFPLDELIVWIESLGEPIEVWEMSPGSPARAIFRIN
jgi:hypothetical protein